MRRRNGWLLAGAALLLATCGPRGPDPETARAEIHELLGRYLPALAAAHAAGGDPLALSAALDALAREAVPKEVVWVRQQAEDQARQGMVVAPELVEFTIEEVHVAGHSTVLVTTVEVWNLRRYALGSDQLLSEALGRSHRVKYHVGRQDGGWQVFSRQVEHAFE